MGVGLALVDVVEVIRHDERLSGLGREPDEALVEPALLGQAVVLQLEEEVAAKDVGVLAGNPAGHVPVVRLERAGDLPVQARR